MSLDVPENFEAFVKDSNRGEIKLSDFSNIFFPMFVAYFNGQPVELSRWLSYTGTKGYEWVDVVRAGEVVFSIPPVLQSITLAPGSSLNQDPAEIMQIATIKDKTIPGAGNRHIRENITNALDFEDDHNRGQEEFLKNWIPIFEFYGYTLGDSSKASSKDTAMDYNPGDFDDYDEL